MIGQDRLAEERKRQVITRAQNRHRVCISWMKTTKMGDVMITEIGPGGIAEVERDLNKALTPELARIDAMTAAQQKRIARGLQSTMRNNLDEHGFEGMRVQIELQPARARLVKVGL